MGNPPSARTSANAASGHLAMCSLRRQVQAVAHASSPPAEKVATQCLAKRAEGVPMSSREATRRQASGGSMDELRTALQDPGGAPLPTGGRVETGRASGR